MTTPKQTTDLCEDPSQFSRVLVEHLNERQRALFKRETNYTWEQVAAAMQYKYFFDDLKPGDRLQFFTWNGGVLAYHEGYQIVRDGKPLRSMTTLVS